MIRLYAYTHFESPGLHLWRPGTDIKIYLLPVDKNPDANGWYRFECELDHQIHQPVHCLLYNRSASNDHDGEYEPDTFIRNLPRLEDDRFPQQVWLAHGANRVILQDPQEEQLSSVHVHLITAKRYRNGQLYLWKPGKDGRFFDATGKTDEGPYWDLSLDESFNHFFLFKFIQQNGTYEPDFANRLWCQSDGRRIWTHSGAPAVLSQPPVKKTLRVFFRQEIDAWFKPQLHLWQSHSDFTTDIPGELNTEGWFAHSVELYTGLGYEFQFWNPQMPAHCQWEHKEAKRTIVVDDDTDVWTLEGDRFLFLQPPVADRAVELEVAVVPPEIVMRPPYYCEVCINRARAPFHPQILSRTDKGLRLSFATYPDVVTSIRIGSASGYEWIDRHTLRVTGEESTIKRYVVINRENLLAERPPDDLFLDPHFFIKRPGVYEDNHYLRFAVHAPQESRVELIGDWTQWRDRPVSMHCTRDGAYWWVQVPVSALTEDMDRPDYHGMQYKFLFNSVREIQDPAAGWVEGSSADSASKLMQSNRFQWQDRQWHTPPLDQWIVYQVHPARFTDRFPGTPLTALAEEIKSQSGYLRQLKVTAVLLMPVNEVGSRYSWGYDPSFYYAVENAYGGPDALKHFVDVCHRHGLAVMLDVVFNHAGTRDNVLWNTARGSFFDGDTQWGAMINFDHPQCRHFFEQNLVYLQKEYHIDGFRLDHTHTIVHSHEQSGFVRKAGSGGGWDFLHGLRRALKNEANPNCFLVAEHLPNEWNLTNYGGPMDSQWCDDFHDRLVDAARGWHVMPQLADAMKLSHTTSDNWYKVTNYPESHDEVGNVNDRIANVAGFGRGLRLSKAAAAVTLLGRGMPMFFMGAESGEYRQFQFGAHNVLPLQSYMDDANLSRVRAWWNTLCQLRSNNNIKGPSPINIHYANGQRLAFSRGHGYEYFIIINFGGVSETLSLAQFNLPYNSVYKELLNSTLPQYAVEDEDRFDNGGVYARLHRGHRVHVADYSVVILEKTG